MKWPKSITLVRHGQSAYNVLRDKKRKDPEYRRFMKAYDENCDPTEMRRLAEAMRRKYPSPASDYETPLTVEGENQARLLGEALSKANALPPDVIFYSPYKRTKDTLARIAEGWNAIESVRAIPDDRIREQEHGLALIYSDWRIFQTLHPEQRILRELQRPYWYQFPQGESVSQVRDRMRQMASMLIREWSGKHVWLVTHHLSILSLRANIEHLTPEEFMHLDETEKPINCGLTVYECNPELGVAGRLQLKCYNQRLFR